MNWTSILEFIMTKVTINIIQQFVQVFISDVSTIAKKHYNSTGVINTYNITKVLVMHTCILNSYSETL